MQYTPELHMIQRATSESIAGDLRRAVEFMNLSNQAQDCATARKYYKKARMAHDAADQLLRQQLPASPSARAEFGAAIARLRSRLVAYESVHS
ncbi:hypothetical protein [Steroidobacter cummioxidans]|uniref:hypothetical protein n=1 Tax=Steroidobacter cummioxidans TaxID=1803913 RepID=UPI000E315967|nr:hypothetical protein [Steroidobacter cummioxidans]